MLTGPAPTPPPVPPLPGGPGVHGLILPCSLGTQGGQEALTQAKEEAARTGPGEDSL